MRSTERHPRMPTCSLWAPSPIWRPRARCLLPMRKRLPIRCVSPSSRRRRRTPPTSRKRSFQWPLRSKREWQVRCLKRVRRSRCQRPQQHPQARAAIEAVQDARCTGTREPRTEQEFDVAARRGNRASTEGRAAAQVAGGRWPSVARDATWCVVESNRGLKPGTPILSQRLLL